ncbi:MAG TPA: iron-sulfur cluster repair di-iron protein [Lacunisphaera sp.]|nr:iron-sulfur cluster repair di-iron protein [Lacunisphaera sp.]
MSNHPITIETTVADIVRAVPGRSRLLDRLGIDYCCGGKKSLADACRRQGLDPATVVTLLNALDATAADDDGNGINPDTLTLAGLCDHIERVHHDYLRQELPRIEFMTRKVAAVHGDHEPRLLEVREVFVRFATAMAAHTDEEEKLVFPAIRRIESAGRAANAAAQLQATLEKLEAEHDRAGAALERFHALTDDFTPPEWACNTFRALYAALRDLDRETHRHVHKENNVLFPRALAACRAA